MAQKNVVVKEASLKKESGANWRAKLIEGNKRGSSAFYPADVLERDGSRAFPAGTKIFFDHPGLEEQWDRPERSVRDLVGVTTTDALYESDGLYANVTIFSNYSELVQEMAEHTGLSIRANGIVEEEEIDGDYVPVLKALTSGQSVDIVTEAGAGGKLVGLLESARLKETPKPKPPSSPKEEIDMKPEEIAALVATAVTEAMKPVLEEVKGLKESAKPEEKTLSFSEIDAKLTEAKLPAPLRGKVLDSVAAGADLDKAITEASALAESIRTEVKATLVTEGNVQDEEAGSTDLRESGVKALKEASALVFG